MTPARNHNTITAQPAGTPAGALAGGSQAMRISEEVSMMARTDIHLDAMLRHLGAAYYESLQGRAARSDVNRALDTVDEHLNEQTSPDREPPVGGLARMEGENATYTRASVNCASGYRLAA
jgi:hypothetical protein